MYTFIVNPYSRTGLGLRVWEDLEQTLRRKKTRYQAFFTKYRGHAANIAAEITSAGERCTIIVLGGDGTINEVVSGLHCLSKVTLGYIPIGSGNDFARGMGLSSDPQAALERILAPSRFAYVNAGILTHGGRKSRFVISAGIGFDAEVCHRISFSGLKKLLNRFRLGKLSYTGVALQSLFLQTPEEMTLTLDGTRVLHFDKVYFTAFMNQKYEGGGFMFCPDADPGDDLLDVIVAAGLSKLKILYLLPTAFFGRHTRFRGIHIYRCRRAEVHSSVSLPLHTDGEPIVSERDVTAELEPEKIKFIIS